ncbi:GNAT family N-acetyltransferase [Pseudonocardia sp. TRM90224]|uniref:GNAT family N-acetyltransferase n=1 Tax=Pseudonocardia sp. TRM90224 TaxID=2812678 RepID=UPI001E3164AA|nr:GNAT family N-acetyltransferase [Pseudonocardia sp. TRM90224]
MRASPPVVVRPADHADSVVIAQTIRGAFAEYRANLVPESAALRETPESISTELRGRSDALLAERAREVLGCVMVKPVDCDLYFGRLAVRTSARGQGVGRLLVAAVEDLARRSGRAGVRLEVRLQLVSNQRFFSALGYREVSRSAHEGFSYPTSMTMRKALMDS